MSSMTIFDRRLIPADAPAGTTPPSLAENTFLVDGTWSLTAAFLWVKNYANSRPGGRIDLFNILCHGYYGWSESPELRASALVGGFGLELCRDGLILGTIDSIAPLVRDKLGDVVIYACGAGSGQAGGPQNGTVFCKQLAKKLNCVVYAADRKQVYTYYTTVPRPLDFGEWEGTVTRFTPDDQAVPVGHFPSPNPT